MVALYPVGIPLFLFYMLFKNRRKLGDEGVRAQLGFLYDGMDWLPAASLLVQVVLIIMVARVSDCIPQDTIISSGGSS